MLGERIDPRQDSSSTYLELKSNAQHVFFQNAAKRMRTDAADNDKLKRKLREAVATALEELGIDLKHKMFTTCGKKLFTICRTFAVVSKRDPDSLCIFCVKGI